MAKDKSQDVETKEAEVVETPKVEIIRGRMPVAIVAQIRFAEGDATTSAIAAKYRTTVGKVDDIRKNRNFGYVDAEFKPTADQLAAAKAYAEQLGDASESVIASLEGMGLAEDGGEAFEAKRSAARKSKKAESTEEAPTGEGEGEEAGEGTDEAGDVVTDADLDDLVD